MNEQLPYLTDQDRLSAYNLLTGAAHHVWSKGKLQEEKAKEILNTFIPLAYTDPYFLSHLLSYVVKRTDNKDLKVFTLVTNALSSADGLPFSVGSTYLKPNLRIISAAAVMQLEPKLVARVLEIASLKYFVAPHLREGRHFPNSLRTAIEKYLTYRENNIEIMKGIKKAGLGNVVKKMYRGLHKNPTDEVAGILRWQQKDHKIAFAQPAFDFKDLSDLQIAEKIRAEQLPVLGVLGALPRSMSPVIAVAILEQCSGNQAVILLKTFEDTGVLKDPEVMKLYQEKIATAKTALDRADTVSQGVSEAVKQALSTARSEKRKEQVGDIGKLFMHIDVSGSMHAALEFAKERGAIIAECVKDPEHNFGWGTFEGHGEILPLPQAFVKDAFAQVLFGRRGGGSTDCFALYPTARAFHADTDVFLSDQGHTDGNLSRKIQEFHTQNPTVAKPKVCVIVHFEDRFLGGTHRIKQAYEDNGIPVAEILPDSLTESALVAQAIRSAIVGPVQLVTEIMNTELLTLPNYYFTL